MNRCPVPIGFEDKVESGRYCRACLKLFNQTNRRKVLSCLFVTVANDDFFACEKCFWKILKDLEDEL